MGQQVGLKREFSEQEPRKPMINEQTTARIRLHRWVSITGICTLYNLMHRLQVKCSTCIIDYNIARARLED